jgi:hypothetical protein
MYICIDKFMYGFKCVLISVYVYIHTYIHTYIYTWIHSCIHIQMCRIHCVAARQARALNAIDLRKMINRISSGGSLTDNKENGENDKNLEFSHLDQGVRYVCKYVFLYPCFY